MNIYHQLILAALAEELTFGSSTHIRQLVFFVTLVSRDVIPSGICEHLHACHIHTDMQVQTYAYEIKLIKALYG